MEKCSFKISEQFNFLKNLSTKELEILQEHHSFVQIRKGEAIFFEGEQLKKLFCICEGACKFSFIDEHGREYITKLLGRGDLMGRRSIITSQGALVTATAISDTTLCMLDKKVVIKSIQKNNNVCQEVLNGFISDTKDDMEKMIYFKNYRTVKVRLAGLLLYLSQKFGVTKSGWINVSLRRQDMANILGTTSEYVISLLTSFKEKEFLNINRKKIKINSVNHLEALISAK